MDSASISEDGASQDARRSCPNCSIRMSSFKYVLHYVCSSCRGQDCNMDNECHECNGWPLGIFMKYIKHKKDIDRKSMSLSFVKMQVN